MAALNHIIDTDELHAFDAVAVHRSFSIAATELGCSQSAISQRIQRLEKRLGRRLIRRTTRSVALTPDGEAMLIYARSILSLAEDARRSLAAPGLRGVLKIGIEDEFATTRLQYILTIFRAEFPDFALKFVTGRNEHLNDALRGQAVDLVLGKRHGEGAGGEPLWQEQLVWVGRSATMVRPEARVNLISYMRPSVTRAMVEAALHDSGRSWINLVEGSNLIGLLAAAEAGAGVMAMGRSFSTPGLVELAPECGLPPLGRLTYVLETAGHAADSEAAVVFAQVLRQAARQLARST